LLGEGLRHDVLDGEVIRRDTTSDVAHILRGALLQDVEEVATVLVHGVEVLGLEGLPELNVARKSPTTPAVQQQVRQNFAVWFVIFTQLLNVTVGSSENIGQGVRTEVRNHTAENKILHGAYERLEVPGIDDTVLVIPVAQPQQWFRHTTEGEVGATQSPIYLFVSCCHILQVSGIHGELMQLLSELAGTSPTLLREIFEGLVHIRSIGSLRCLGDEEP